jgi:hypothetical protein
VVVTGVLNNTAYFAATMIQAWKSIVSFLVSGMVGSWVGVGVHNNPN